MKRLLCVCLALTLLLLSALCLFSCGTEPTDSGASSTRGEDGDRGLLPVREIDAKRYVRERDGSDGAFIILLKGDGTYQYYSEFVSSYLGIGTWTYENGVVTLTENKEFCGNDNAFRFRVAEEGLIFIADGSDKFLYVDVRDGDRFLPDDGIIWDEEKYTPDYASTSTLHADAFLEKLKTDGYHRGDEIDKNYNTSNITGIYNITPQAILEEKPDLEIFLVKDGYHCFLTFKGEIYRYDTFGGYHYRLVLWDYDGNGVKDLVSYHSWGSGISRLSVSITDLTTMETYTVVSRIVPPFPGFSFAFDGENVFIDGEKLTYSDGSFHYGEQE